MVSSVGLPSNGSVFNLNTSTYDSSSKKLRTYIELDAEQSFYAGGAGQDTTGIHDDSIFNSDATGTFNGTDLSYTSPYATDSQPSVNGTTNNTTPFQYSSDGYTYWLNQTSIPSDICSGYYLRLNNQNPDPVIDVKIAQFSNRNLSANFGQDASGNFTVTGLNGIENTSYWDTAYANYNRFGFMGVYNSNGTQFTNITDSFNSLAGFNSANNFQDLLDANNIDGQWTTFAFYMGDRVTFTDDLEDENPAYNVYSNFYNFSYFYSQTKPTALRWRATTDYNGYDRTHLWVDQIFGTTKILRDDQTNETYSNITQTEPTKFFLGTKMNIKPKIYLNGKELPVYKGTDNNGNSVWLVDMPDGTHFNDLTIVSPDNPITSSGAIYPDGATDLTINGDDINYTPVNHYIQSLHRRFNLAPHYNYDALRYDFSTLSAKDNVDSFITQNDYTTYSGERMIFTLNKNFSESLSVENNTTKDALGKEPIGYHRVNPDKGFFNLGLGFSNDATDEYLEFKAHARKGVLPNEYIKLFGGINLNNRTLVSSAQTDTFSNLKSTIFDEFLINPYAIVALADNKYIGADLSMGWAYIAKAEKDIETGEPTNNYLKYPADQLGINLTFAPFSPLSGWISYDSETWHDNYGKMYNDCDGAGHKNTTNNISLGIRSRINNMWQLEAEYTYLRNMAYANSSPIGLNNIGLGSDFTVWKGNRFYFGVNLNTTNYGSHKLGFSGESAKYTYGNNPEEKIYGVNYSWSKDSWILSASGEYCKENSGMSNVLGNMPSDYSPGAENMSADKFKYTFDVTYRFSLAD